MPKRDIIVIGASAGGILALKNIVSMLPADCEAAIFIVQHVSAHGQSYLPDILSRAGRLRAKHPEDGELILPGTIYIAPPDYHMLLENDRILVRHGPKENRFRPSVDALFRSAAYTYGSRVTGVVLTGMLNDGTSGMWAIKHRGGVGIIQDPEEAEYPSMPSSVLEFVEVDYILPIAEIGNLLCRLTGDVVPDTPAINEADEQRMKVEVDMAAQDNGFEMGIMNMGDATYLTCPECHGALVSIKEGKFERFRCHTGHGFTANDLLAELSKSTEETLWNAVRALEEAIMILERTGENFRNSGNTSAVEQVESRIEQIRERISAIRGLVFQPEPFVFTPVNNEHPEDKKTEV